MNRLRIIFFVGLAVLVVAFALPSVARADGTSDGWTWEDAVATSPQPAPDGWTWDTDAAPAPDGWTWDEAISADSSG